jgi:thymidylate synthase (FAD)
MNKSEYNFDSIKCLDHGFVRLVDVMGDDSSIVQAARVSYGKGTKSVNEDRALIRHLMRHRHTSPFEMVEFKFHVKLPIFVARQWIRHRTANVNEYSGRYSEMRDEFYTPEPEQIRHQSAVNKQGRSNVQLPNETAQAIADMFVKTQKNLFDEYSWTLQQDTAREIARINLPLSTYTEWYWKIDLHNLFHFLRLRLAPDAQYEIRVYGEAIGSIIKPIVPLAYEAFEDFTLNSMTFSSKELAYLRDILGNFDIDSLADTKELLSKSELREFKEKLAAIKALGE